MKFRKNKPYPAYKDSGIEWIGEIPEHWTVTTVGKVSKLGRGRVISKNEIFDNVGEYPVYSSQTEKNGVLGYLKTYDFEGEYVTWTTDGANAGTVYYRTGKFNCTNVCGTMKPKGLVSIDLKYLAYLLSFNTKRLVRLDINPKLMNNVIAKAVVLIPFYNEQTAIASFLDHRTSKIDQLIQEKQELIELLKKKKTALITKCVTKGLDDNVPMKDSGVEWIGEIPEHWEIRRLKFCIQPRTEKDVKDDFIVSLENIEGWTGKYISSENKYNDTGVLFKRNDILFGKLRPYLAKVYLAPRQGVAIGDFFVLQSIERAEFLFYLLLSKSFIQEINSSTFGAKMPRVSFYFFSNLQVPVPDTHEQQRIASYLDQQTTKIDQAISEIQESIDLLQRYRTSLITNAVTGKIDVRDWDAGIELNQDMEGTHA